jgi:hypothetical protein
MKQILREIDNLTTIDEDFIYLPVMNRLTREKINKVEDTRIFI